MTKKTIAANAEKLAVNDERPEEGCTKFICKIPEFHFMMPVHDEKGEEVFHGDRHGNARLPTTKLYSFVKVYAQKGKDGKFDPSTAYCFFIVNPKIHGTETGNILKYLTGLMKNPIYQLFSEEDYFKNRNPEAFRIAKEKTELENAIDAEKAKVADLERRLGLQRK
jgi:hypothetical protein